MLFSNLFDIIHLIGGQHEIEAVIGVSEMFTVHELALCLITNMLIISLLLCSIIFDTFEHGLH